jgi:pyocin large subunit-like protein
MAASIATLSGCQQGEKPVAVAAAPTAPQTITQAPANSVRTSIGFRSSHYLDEHFAKHGREFQGMSKAEYLLAAQTLRDSPVGGDVEEIVRSDGTASRFDSKSGAFIAFNRNGTIRTFFKPNDGELYFRRQAQRSH